MRFYILAFDDATNYHSFFDEIGDFIRNRRECYYPINSSDEFCSLIDGMTCSGETIVFHCIGHGTRRQDNTEHSGINPVPWNVIADKFALLRNRCNALIVNLMSVCYSAYFKIYKDAYDVLWTIEGESPCLDIPTMIYTDNGYLDWTSYSELLNTQANYGYEQYT